MILNKCSIFGYICIVISLVSIDVNAQGTSYPSSNSEAINRSGDVARSTFIQLMDVEFRQKDADGDGSIARIELEQFERNKAFLRAQEEARASFVSLDLDGNSQLSLLEFLELTKNPQIPDLTSQMERFDINRDQNISLVEYRTAMLVNFDRLDADKDGIVTEREMSIPSTPVGR